MILGNVTPKGQLSDRFEGRLLNPGHAIEAIWFVMDLGVRRHDRKLIEGAVKITLDTLEYGWDRGYSGVFYFLDRKSASPRSSRDGIKNFGRYTLKRW